MLERDLYHVERKTGRVKIKQRTEAGLKKLKDPLTKASIV